MTDLNTMGESVGALLKQREQTVAVAESSAGGLISASLLAVPGASAYYRGAARVVSQVERQNVPQRDDAKPRG